MKKQFRIIQLFSKFCLENNLEYKVEFSGVIRMETKLFLLRVEQNGLATVYIHKTGEILECRTQIQMVFSKIFEQII